MKQQKKYVVYYNDEVNETADVFSADTLEECRAWVDEDLRGRTPIDEEHPCTDDVMYTASTFRYDVYDRPIVEVVDDEEILNEPVYSTDYYYAD
ncbi:MAG: hypothetical protein ACI3YB_01955 [Prevotella sp.]